MSLRYKLDLQLEWAIGGDPWQLKLDVQLQPTIGIEADLSGGVSLLGVLSAGVTLNVDIGYTLKPGLFLGKLSADQDPGGASDTCGACLYIKHSMSPTKLKLKGYVEVSIDPCFGLFGGCRIGKK